MKLSGVPITRFAKRIGCSAKTVHAIFKRPSIDTMLLKKCSEVLRFDFFSLYTEDLRVKGSRSSTHVVHEPAAPYARREGGDGLEIIIRPGQNKELIERVLRAIDPKNAK